MKVLGARRVMLLLVLVAINVLLAAVVYGYMLPSKGKAERELRAKKAEVSRVQTDIERMRVEFDQLEEQKERFEGLKKSGFFIDQERRQAEDLFALLQERTNVISAKASIKPGTVEDNEEAAKAGHKILSSPVEIEIEAILDTDIYHYIYLLEQFFPGHVDITSMDIIRDIDVNRAVISSIASGASPPLMKARLSMIWRTMIPEDAVIRTGN